MKGGAYSLPSGPLESCRMEPDQYAPALFVSKVCVAPPHSSLGLFSTWGDRKGSRELM